METYGLIEVRKKERKMKQKLFATIVTVVVAAIAGFAIGYLGSSGSIGGWIAFPKAAVGLLCATFIGLTTLFTSTLLSFAADQTGKTWWIYSALNFTFTVLASVILAALDHSNQPLITIELLGTCVVVGVANGLVYYFAERYAINKA